MNPESSSLTLAGSESRRGLAERLVRARLERLRDGVLHVVGRDGRRRSFGTPASDGLDATLRVHDERLWRHLLTGGALGAGEAYVEGWWSADDLTRVVRVLARNRDALEALDGGLARLARPALRWLHRRNRNTRDGARRNVSAHYDLSNDFFALLLDPTMTYSCGVYEREEATLEEAQIAKIDRLCRKLRLGPDDHLLEIGTGWGALAVHAAHEYGCRVTTTTISREQHAFARERIAASDAADRIELLRSDYRDLTGQYDKIVSVEMIEAVGAEYLDAYFGHLSRLLKPGGVAAIQAITIQDQRFEGARRSVDFIQRHVFPGSCIPSVTALCAAMTRASDLKMLHLEDLTPHYARTLAAWRENLFAHEAEVRAMGRDDRFLRTWDYYLSYCEGGFAERHVGDVQMLVARPGSRHAPPLPPRAHLG